MKLVNILWGILALAIVIFIFAFLAQNSSNGLVIEPPITFACFITCSIIYIISCLKYKTWNLSWGMAFLGYFIFRVFIFQYIFVLWLHLFYSPEKDSVWEGKNGYYYYIDKSYINDPGDAQYSGQASTWPPWVQAPR